MSDNNGEVKNVGLKCILDYLVGIKIFGYSDYDFEYVEYIRRITWSYTNHQVIYDWAFENQLCERKLHWVIFC